MKQRYKALRIGSGVARILAVAVLATLSRDGVAVTCGAPGSGPHLALDTAAGRVVVALVPESAPTSVEWVIRLARGPVFDPGLIEGKDVPGFYDGLAFDYTRPNLELRTADRPPSGSFRHPIEVNAAALGLDHDTIDNAGAAMDVWQFELYPHFTYHEHRGGVTPQLEQWVRQWRDTGEVEFLVGASRQDINEALSYRYTPELHSLPPERGVVLLHPASPRQSTPRLRFLLADHPKLAGRATAIGRVDSGMEVLEEIAARPVVPPPHQDKNAFHPARPVTVREAVVECQPKQ